MQGVTKRCRLSWTLGGPIVPSYMSPNAGGGGSCGVSANECSWVHGAQINFGDLAPYLTYGIMFQKRGPTELVHHSANKGNLHRPKGAASHKQLIWFGYIAHLSRWGGRGPLYQPCCWIYL